MDSIVNGLISAIDGLRDNITHDKIKDCKDALNQIFVGKSRCNNFLYTINTDKIAFGCIVMPIINGEAINQMLIDGEPIKFDKYDIELDSKIFDYGLTNEQIAQVILYNVYHLTNDTTPAIRFRNALDIYFAEHDTQLVIQKSIQYQPILTLGLVDTLVQFTNCMYATDDVVSDPFLESLGLDNFNDTLDILFNQIPGCYNATSRAPKLTMLDWCIRLYDNVDKERIPAIRLLEKVKTLTASTLYIQKMNNVINSLNRIDTDNYLNESVTRYVTEAKKRGSLFSQIKYNGLRGIEDDLYEFMVRARNAETEDEVFYALKQINVRLSILDDYLRFEDMSDADRDRWSAVRDKYAAIRDEIAHKKVYNRKNYGIFVDYNKIDSMDGEDQYSL